METDYVRIGQENLKWFYPLFSEGEERLLQVRDDICAIGAVVQAKAAGMVLFSFHEREILIRRIAVSEDMRNQGVATGLLRYLCTLSNDSGAVVSADFYAEEKYDDIYSLFTDTGFFSIQEIPGGIVSLPLKSFEGNELLKKAMNTAEKSRIKSLASLSEGEKNLVIQNVQEEGRGFVSKQELSECLQTASFVAASENVFSGIALVKKDDSGLELSYVYLTSNGSYSFVPLVASVLSALMETDPEESISITVANELSEKLLLKLVPDATYKIKHYRAFYDMTL